MNILTIDLEDWFHIIDVGSASDKASWSDFDSRVEANANRILDKLEEKKIKATWFCLGWIAGKYPDLIKRIAVRHEVGCHSMYHELIYRNGFEKTAEDIHRNKAELESLTGKKVDSYRAPGFSFHRQSKWLVDILIKEGFRNDCSVFPASRNHGGFEKFPASSPCRLAFNNRVIYEFPMNTVTVLGKKIVFSGGGYFRLLPYSWINKWVKESDYVMSYFHPRDFDPDQPMLPGMSLKRKFMSYTGLKKSFSKFNHLLNDHKFVAVEDAASMIRWDKTPLIQIDEL